jgi:hypothetical protein
MRQTIIALGLLCALFPALVLAGTGPRIRFSEREHDFGDIIHGQSPSFEFIYSNAGDGDLVIEQVASPCGCAKGRRGEAKSPPGGSGKIFTQIRTFGTSPGKQSKSIAVHSNDTENPVIFLTLKFNVVRHVTIQPETLTTWLSTRDKPALFKPSATNNGKVPVTLKAGKPAGEVDAKLEPQEVVVPPGATVQFQLTVLVSGQTSRPYVNGKIDIETDASGERSVPVRYLIYLPKADAK